MANLGILASGNGTNFQALIDAVDPTEHETTCLVCNRRESYVLERAAKAGIPSVIVDYTGRRREEAELEILSYLRVYGVDLVALAGFMKLLTPLLIDAYPGRIINIHPSLLPKYPGTGALEKSYRSNDDVLGITIHRIDYGLDTGPVILQKSFKRAGNESLEEIEGRIHSLEHTYYPQVILELLATIEAEK
jgi:phosphoribosylglycinamide formyltransferase-1